MDDDDDLDAVSRWLIDGDITVFDQYARGRSNVGTSLTDFRINSGALELFEEILEQAVGRWLVFTGDIVPDLSQLRSGAGR